MICDMYNMLALFLGRNPRGKPYILQRIKKRIHSVVFDSYEKEKPELGIFSSPFGN